MLLALAYERSGSVQTAEGLYEYAVKLSDFNPVIGLSYVSFLKRQGRIQRAVDILAGLASHQPKNLTILSALAEIKLIQQDWYGAEQIAKAIRDAGDITGLADQVLGAALTGQHKYDESIAAFQNAIDASPSAVQPMVSLVGALVRSQKPDKAVAFLESTLQANPDNVEAQVLLGSAQLAAGAPIEARKTFSLAIARQPRSVIGYQALASLLASEKRFYEALEVIQSGLRVQPDSMMLHLALAAALEGTRQYDAAIDEYEYMLSQQPDSTIVANNLASLLSDHRADKASLERAQSVVESLGRSKIPQFKDTLGWLSYRRGDFKDAVGPLEEAAAALPNSAVVHYHLGMNFIAITQTAEAAKQLKLAQYFSASLIFASNSLSGPSDWPVKYWPGGREGGHRDQSSVRDRRRDHRRGRRRASLLRFSNSARETP